MVITKTYPQFLALGPSYSVLRDTREAGLYPPFKSIQVLDKKGENTAIHRSGLPLSTTTNLK